MTNLAIFDNSLHFVNFCRSITPKTFCYFFASNQKASNFQEA